jgi:6-phosphogluconolactonase (cycloisomerase 2 family)
MNWHRLAGMGGLCVMLALTACGGGQGSDGSTPAPVDGGTGSEGTETGGSDTGGSDTGAVDPGNTGSSPVSLVSYPLFESGQVRPLARSADGTRLFAVNTPAHRLEIFTISEGGLSHTGSVPVGLEPVAVAARPNGEVWVVNHVSDSVSIVDSTAAVPVVIDTLWVGDEPSDIVFAGPSSSRAFITSARRGQNHVLDPQLTTPGTGRANVWVFDADDTGAGPGGTPLTVLTLFGNTPRALARSADGNTVYAGILHSGNRTTTVPADRLAKTGPTTDTNGTPAPDTGIIVRYDGSAWRDGDGNDFSSRVRLDLPDHDVFAINAAATTPVVTGQWSGVGTTLFNIAVNPQSGKLYVSNLEARNDIRFEGSGSRGSTLRGHFVESRISVIDGTTVTPRHLNKHIDYSRALGTAEEKSASLATPLEMVVSADGDTLYTAAFGSAAIGVFPVAALEDGSFTPSASQQIAVPGGGPSGLVLDDASQRLYVLTRFDNSVSVINLDSRQIIDTEAMTTPEPAAIRNGRRFLYDARLTSSRGDSSCAGCHIFGDLDLLAWDLGNPDEHQVDNPNPYVDHPTAQAGKKPFFHPLKGPMTTQSLRGMAGNGPMHWRGDKPGGTRVEGEALELGSFREFNGAFVNLLGRESTLNAADMDAFAVFALALMYPPNPYRQLDNSLTASQAAGRNTYLNAQTTGGTMKCQTCHVLDPSLGDFGTAGLTSIEGPDISQNMKVPQLRNMVVKVGMFGMGLKGTRNGPEMGDQISGFGFSNDGSVDTLSTFLSASVFRFSSAAAREQVVDFVFAFDSDHAPVVGQQVTLDASSDEAALARADLLAARAAITSPRRECDLIAHGRISGSYRMALRGDDGVFRTAQSDSLSFTTLKTLARSGSNVVTLLCVPPGAGATLAAQTP